MSLAPIVDRAYGTNVTTRPAATTTRPAAQVAQGIDKTSVPAAADQIDQQRLQAAVEAANKFLQPVARNLQFTIDQDSGKTIVKVIDTETDKVVRQIPSEEMLAISRALGRMQGMMVERHV